jgi:hypothetical protein
VVNGGKGAREEELMIGLANKEREAQIELLRANGLGRRLR